MTGGPTGLLVPDGGVPWRGPSGACAHVRGITHALHRHSGVLLGVARLEDKRGAVVPPPSVPTTVVPPRRWGWVPRAWRDHGGRLDGERLADTAAQVWPDIARVWERHAGPADGGHRLARARGVPYLLELNAPYMIEKPGTVYWGPTYVRLETEAIERADRVLTVSPWLMEWVVQRTALPQERVCWVPNGTSLTGVGEREATRERLGLGKALTLLFVGSLRPWHGVQWLGEVLDELPDAVLLVAGQGPVTPPEHPRLRTLGRVPEDDLPDLIAAADVGLLPYPKGAPHWFDPLKLWDYRSQGLPVVGSDVPALREALQPERHELLARPDPASFALAIRRVWGSRAPRWVRTWDQVVAEALDGL